MTEKSTDIPVLSRGDTTAKQLEDATVLALEIAKRAWLRAEVNPDRHEGQAAGYFAEEKLGISLLAAKILDRM